MFVWLEEVTLCRDIGDKKVLEQCLPHLVFPELRVFSSHAEGCPRGLITTVSTDYKKRLVFTFLNGWEKKDNALWQVKIICNSNLCPDETSHGDSDAYLFLWLLSRDSCRVSCCDRHPEAHHTWTVYCLVLYRKGLLTAVPEIGGGIYPLRVNEIS